jgi:hypothetical protein
MSGLVDWTALDGRSSRVIASEPCCESVDTVFASVAIAEIAQAP